MIRKVPSPKQYKWYRPNVDETAKEFLQSEKASPELTSKNS